MRIPTRLQSLVPVLICLFAAVVFSGCKKTPQQQILGKWNVDGEQSVVEYRKDGTCTTTQNGKSTTGHYRFLDNSHMELEASGTQGTNTIVLRFACEVVFHGDKADVTASLPGKAGSPPVTQTLHYTRAD